MNVLKTIPQKLSQNAIRPITIVPCKGVYPVCLCVEYLDFHEKKDIDHYKNCYLTSLKVAPCKFDKKLFG